jgi:hypothetical protein
LFNSQEPVRCETPFVGSKPASKFKEMNDNEQLEIMQLRTVPGCRLHLRLPEHRGVGQCHAKQCHSLRLRSQLQMRPVVFVQKTVSMGERRARRTSTPRGVPSGQSSCLC